MLHFDYRWFLNHYDIILPGISEKSLADQKVAGRCIRYPSAIYGGTGSRKVACATAAEA
jgi:hypothetical protein